MSAGDAAARRHGWLDLLQQSGPFVTVPVADRVWPAGLPTVPAPVRAQLRFAMAELLDGDGMSQAELAQAVLVDTLGWTDALKEGPEIPAAMTEVVTENGVVLRPDFGFYAEPEDTNDDDDERRADERRNLRLLFLMVAALVLIPTLLTIAALAQELVTRRGG